MLIHDDGDRQIPDTITIQNLNAFVVGSLRRLTHVRLNGIGVTRQFDSIRCTVNEVHIPINPVVPRSFLKKFQNLKFFEAAGGFVKFCSFGSLASILRRQQDKIILFSSRKWNLKLEGVIFFTSAVLVLQ